MVAGRAFANRLTKSDSKVIEAEGHLNLVSETTWRESRTSFIKQLWTWELNPLGLRPLPFLAITYKF